MESSNGKSIDKHLFLVYAGGRPLGIVEWLLYEIHPGLYILPIREAARRAISLNTTTTDKIQLYLEEEEYNHLAILCPLEFVDIHVPTITRLMYLPFDDEDVQGNMLKTVEKTRFGQPVRETLFSLASQYASALTSKQKVICACWRGLNRSSLLATLIMIENGIHPEEAHLRIRKARGPDALSNPLFLRWIQEAYSQKIFSHK